jgi:anti-sigma regulatory factor (Ser/Thr protein kinase)
MKRFQKFSIDDSSISGEIRRTISGWSSDLELDETKSGAVSIVINELVTNILKHAHRGEIIATMDARSISILSIDTGPGIENISKALEDGYSSSGTAGNGLGAVRRLSSEFDIYSVKDTGTIVLAKFNKSENSSENFECHGFSLPMKGEQVSGDDWADKQKSHFKILVADGLGHGLLAHEAAKAALHTFMDSRDSNLLDEINLLHLSLRSTRGAAVAIAQVQKDKNVLEYCGLGNIAGAIVGRNGTKRLISYNGTAGVQLRKVQSLPYPFEKDSLLIMHSDGLSTNWNILDYPGLIIKHPLLIAGLLYRDYTRGTDDVTVVVGK